MSVEPVDLPPVCKNRKIKGTRRVAREKVLQILMAHQVSGTELDFLFPCIFFREYSFEDVATEQGKLLTPEEILDLESDTPIEWLDVEIDYAKTLIRYIINNKNDLDAYIESYAKNWDLNRLAMTDRIILHIAISELITFPSIPSKVSMNEALNISKSYSTEKSSNFINGILDSVFTNLTQNGKINKTGRGLLDKKN